MAWVLSKDGVDDYGQAANPVTGYPFSFMAYVKRSKASASQSIISIAHPTANNVYYALAFDTSNRPIIQCANTTARLATAPTASGTDWMQVIACFDSASSRRIIVDGVEQVLSGAPTTAVNFNVDCDRLLVGLLRTVAPTWYYGGLIREVSIWNKSFSEDETRVYKNHKLAGTEEGLLRYWKFDTGSGATENDIVAADPMTFYGSTWAEVTEFLLDPITLPAVWGINLITEPKKPIIPGINIRINPSFPQIAGISFNIIGNNFFLTVKHKDGTPIPGVTVVLNSGYLASPIILTTDADGFVETQLMTAQNFDLYLEYNGKQFYKDKFYMNYEEKGIYEWEISLSKQQSLYITPEKAYVNPRPQDPERNILI